MSNAIKFPAERQPATQTDDRGYETFTRPWLIFFQQLYERVGGATGSGTTGIEASLFEDAGTGETNAALFTAEQALQQLPVQVLMQTVESLAAEVAAQRDLIAELTKEVDSIKQGTMV
jgi:hypothetical protein